MHTALLLKSTSQTKANRIKRAIWTGWHKKQMYAGFVHLKAMYLHAFRCAGL